MKVDWTIVSHYVTQSFSLWMVGRICIMSLGLRGLKPTPMFSHIPKFPFVLVLKCEGCLICLFFSPSSSQCRFAIPRCPLWTGVLAHWSVWKGQGVGNGGHYCSWPVIVYLKWCAYDINHICGLQIKNRIVKQLKQLQRNVFFFFLGFLCDCLSCFTTVKITFV